MKSIDVLIVDPDVEASATLQGVLEQNGCMARTAASATHALTELRRRRPEIVVLARALGGSGLAEAIASESIELGAIGIVAIVAATDPAPGPRVEAYLREPVMLEVITDLVRRLGADMRAARAAAREASA